MAFWYDYCTRIASQDCFLLSEEEKNPLSPPLRMDSSWDRLFLISVIEFFLKIRRIEFGFCSSYFLESLNSHSFWFFHKTVKPWFLLTLWWWLCCWKFIGSLQTDRQKSTKNNVSIYLGWCRSCWYFCCCWECCQYRRWWGSTWVYLS